MPPHIPSALPHGAHGFGTHGLPYTGLVCNASFEDLLLCLSVVHAREVSTASHPMSSSVIVSHGSRACGCSSLSSCFSLRMENEKLRRDLQLLSVASTNCGNVSSSSPMSSVFSPGSIAISATGSKLGPLSGEGQYVSKQHEAGCCRKTVALRASRQHLEKASEEVSEGNRLGENPVRATGDDNAEGDGGDLSNVFERGGGISVSVNEGIDQKDSEAGDVHFSSELSPIEDSSDIILDGECQRRVSRVRSPDSVGGSSRDSSGWIVTGDERQASGRHAGREDSSDASDVELSPASLRRPRAATEQSVALCQVWRPQGSISEDATTDRATSGDIVRRRNSNMARLTRAVNLSSLSHENLRSDALEGVGCCSRMVVWPNTSQRLAWDLAGIACIMYDLCVIPLQVFDLPVDTVTLAFDWLICIFWTVDVPSTFFVGFYNAKGFIEMRPRMIALHYAKTWLTFDILVVGIDWVVLINSSTQNDAGLARLGKTFRISKTLRFLRMFRLLRLFKAEGILRSITQFIRSDYTRTMIGVAKLLSCILIANHLIACCWYGISVLVPEGEKSWVKVAFVPEDEIGYRYMTSLHWSLTQLMPASMEVYPHNPYERLFNLFVVFFSMIAFTSLISGVTNAMTHLRELNSRSQRQEAQLRRFLGENQISMNLASHVWGCASASLKDSNHRIHEKDVTLLENMPKSVVTELRVEVYYPILIKHPFFNLYAIQNPVATRDVLNVAMTEVSLNAGQELFVAGQPATAMFHLMKGLLDFGGRSTGKLYTSLLEVPDLPQDETDEICTGISRRLSRQSQDSQDSIPAQATRDRASTITTNGASVAAYIASCSSTVTEGQWVNEASLWQQRSHKSTLVAKSHCEVARLDAKKFRQVMSKYVAREPQVMRYAALFKMKSKPFLAILDVWYDGHVIEELTWEAFQSGAGEIDGPAAVNTKVTAVAAKWYRTRRAQSVNSFGSGLGSVASATRGWWTKAANQSRQSVTSTLSSRSENTGF